MAISEERIEMLASGRGVNGDAVRNFLGSMRATNCGPMDTWGNASMDAGLYEWSAKTVAAIRVGIAEHFDRRGSSR